MPTTLQALQERRRFRDQRDWKQFHNPKDLAAALAVEASELQEIFLWQRTDEASRAAEERRERVEEELADVLIQALNFADAVGICAGRRRAQDRNQRAQVPG